jgi:cyclophilin family peptidyl-prolyl cis-trans isomerase
MWQYDHGQYESAYEVGHKLLKIDPSNDFARLLVGMSSLLTNRFGEARQFRAQHGASLALFEPEAIAFENELFSEIELLENNFQQEMALREQEAKADDLPRVQMKTTKGTIMLELFENHAPDTVANFISLVEAKHYDGKIFNRVVNRFMAQAGGFREDQSYHVPGYKIYDEHTRPDARRHFRGVVSMANTGRPNSADAEFFITMVPRPSLDGKYTAFGRVVSGMEAVDRLNRTVRMEEDNKEVAIEGVVPDQIISATVVRKREHEYRPNKFSEPNEE